MRQYCKETALEADLFDANWYVRRYPDVAAAVDAGWFDACTHFDVYGLHEGRSPGPLFDTAFYTSSNPDVAAAVAAGLTTAYEHFLQHGAAEDRAPVRWFDREFYLLHNPDVAKAVEEGRLSAVQHFIRFGWREDRSIGPLFDADAYLEAHPDVAAAVSRGEMTALEHFLQYGEIEGREWGETPAPVPPPPPPPDDSDDPEEPDDGPITVHHLYPNDEITARSIDKRFVIHVEQGEESWIKIHQYNDRQIVDLAYVDGLQVFGPGTHALQLHAVRGQHTDEGWKWDEDGGTSVGVKIGDTPHVQLTDAYGKTVRFHVGNDASSYGYRTVRMDMAEITKLPHDESIDPDIGVIIGERNQLLVGGDGTQVVALDSGDMARGEEGTDIFVLVDHEGMRRPAIIGDYSYGVDAPIVLPSIEIPAPVTVPYQLQLRHSDLRLDPGRGLVKIAAGGDPTDLELFYEDKKILHVADVNSLTGAAGESVSFLLGNGARAVFNLVDGGEIDTTGLVFFGGAEGDLFGMCDHDDFDDDDFDEDDDDDDDDDCECECPDAVAIEYLIGGEGSQNIIGGKAAFAALHGGGGDDHLTSLADWAVYVGGEGCDRLELSAESWNWVFFEGDAATNGRDLILNFQAGEGGDVLDFAQFLWGISLTELAWGAADPEWRDWENGSVIPPEGAKDSLIVVKAFANSEPVEDEFTDFSDAEKIVAVNLANLDDEFVTIWFYDRLAEGPRIECVGVMSLADDTLFSEDNFTTPVFIEPSP